MKQERHDIFTSTQHVRHNAPYSGHGADWEPKLSTVSCGKFHGQGRSLAQAWIGVNLSTVSYREFSGLRVSIPKGSEMIHWQEGSDRFVAWKLKSGLRIIRLEANRAVRRLVNPPRRIDPPISPVVTGIWPEQPKRDSKIKKRVSRILI